MKLKCVKDYKRLSEIIFSISQKRIQNIKYQNSCHEMQEGNDDPSIYHFEVY